MTETPGILLCQCAYSHVLSPQAQSDVRLVLADAGVDFEVVDDLCGLAAKRDDKLKRYAQAEHLKIVACYPRAVKWLFATAGAPLDDNRVELFNLRSQGVDEVLAAILPDKCSTGTKAASDAPSPSSADSADSSPAPDWIPWYPVIDYDRCIGCKQCMNFCLFGVFTTDADGRVVVENPANCKLNCPACGRICPAAAIIFPKYKSSPINGDEISASSGEKAQVDISAALGGDIYAALRSRACCSCGAAKESPGDAKEQAYRLRQKHLDLERLGKELDVPAELMAGLGSSQEPACDCGNSAGCDCAEQTDASEGGCGCSRTQ